MKGKKKRARPARSLKQVPNSLIRRLSAGRGPILPSRIVLAVICIYALAWAIGSADTIVVPVSDRDIRNWDLSKVHHFEQGPDYFLIRCDQPCYVIAPPLSYFGVAPTRYPYVSFVLDPASDFHDFRLLAAGPGEQWTFNPRPVSFAMPGQLLCDLRAGQPWNRIPPFPSSLAQVGLSFSGTLLLRRIEIINYLSLSGYGRLLYATMTEIEPPAPYSINDLYGIRLFGFPHTIVVFFLFAACFVVSCSFLPVHFSRCISLSAAIALLFLLLPSAAYLRQYFRLAEQHSALKYDVFDEYAACYGEEFAALSRRLYDLVPSGSRVHFLAQSLDGYTTETNLIEFIHRTRFQPEAFGSADYYFGYRWSRIYNRNAGSLRDPFSEKSARVQPLYEQGDSFILKAVR
jgi:hypothetical protein